MVGCEIMKYIIRNIRLFMTNQRGIYFLSIAAVMSSVFLLHFSYSLYQSFMKEKDALYEKEDFTEEEDDRPRIAIVGKPNVGKSSIINKLVGENRVIVSDIAGTTRDAIDTEFENENGKYVLIDTAGVRKKSKIKESIEKFSIMRTLLAIERADVCILMIDATEGVTEQDSFE